GEHPDLEAAGRAWAETLNDAVLELGRRLGVPDGVGTTLTGLVFFGPHVLLIHTGDSRAYLWHAGRLGQLTEDQTLGQELSGRGRSTGEERSQGVYRHVLVSPLGTTNCRFEARWLPPLPGDRLLLASDGLLEGLTPAELAELVGTSEPEQAALALVRRSQE